MMNNMITHSKSGVVNSLLPSWVPEVLHGRVIEKEPLRPSLGTVISFLKLKGKNDLE